MFTNVGLICFVILYCIIGALVFEYLEKQNEIEVKLYRIWKFLVLLFDSLHKLNRLAS